MPASMQMSTRRVASATSVAPQALKNSFPPPNVPVPKLSTGTFKPDRPSVRNSIGDRCSLIRQRCACLSLKMLPDGENEKSDEDCTSPKGDQRNPLNSPLLGRNFGELVAKIRSDLEQ